MELPELPPPEEIPTLESLGGRRGDGRPVRFRGMLQDMLDPEFYLEAFEAVDRVTQQRRRASGKYRDRAEVRETERVDYGSPTLRSAERLTFRVIAVPALNGWAQRLGRPAGKRPRLEGGGAPGPERGFPLAGERADEALVKVYERGDEFKLNDALEVVGYLSADDSGPPTIHAVSLRKLVHCNPLLEADAPPPDGREARERLRKVLSQALMGDELAADYLSCHLMSRVYARRDVLALGGFSLNLCRVPDSYPEKLYGVVEKLATKSHYLPFTVDDLNRLTLVPAKDYESGRMKSGLLQLSDNTHLVLDETLMRDGKLEAPGVANLAALDRAMREHRVAYDFGFYRTDFACDLPFLILSEGRSLLEADFVLPLACQSDCLQITDQIFEAAHHYLNEETADAIRTYLTTARFGEYRLSEEPEFIEEDFVAMRGEFGATEDDLHRLLVLTRLVCLSRGLSVLDRDCWNVAKDMEAQRRARLAALPRK